VIKRIKVTNFLSLREVDLALEVRNVLVGPNMSGKTNLIECFRFLQEAATRRTSNDSIGLQRAFSKRGGFAELLWRGQSDGRIGIALEIDHASASAADRSATEVYELSFQCNENGTPEVEGEKLTITDSSRSTTVLDNSGGKLRFIGGHSDGPQIRLGLAIETYGQGLSPPISNFWNFIASWRFYHLVPALMRASNPPGWDKSLLEHGQNLSTWLLVFQNYPEEFRRLKQACCDVLPGLDEIVFQPVEAPAAGSIAGGQTVTVFESAKISVGVAEKPFKRPITLSRMSDGELAFLGLTSVILAPEELSPPLLCIEEPENYLHPRLIEVLVELLNQRATEAQAPQILLTTHSPLLIDRLTIDDLIVVEKSEGASRFTRPSSKKHLRKLLSSKESSLGDLWYSGALTDS
jgi:predicted ATPase